MDHLLFNVDEAIEFGKRGEIEEWVHLFLNSVGDNRAFSEGLKLQKRYWIGPLLIELNKLKRCCGPEPEMQFVDSAEAWEKHISKFQELIRNNWDMPPLIVQHLEDQLVINDGNHRWEAMKREKFDKCWVIIWGSEDEEQLRKYGNHEFSTKE